MVELGLVHLVTDEALCIEVRVLCVGVVHVLAESP